MSDTPMAVVSDERTRRRLAWVLGVPLALTVPSSAFLLFQVQPLMGKRILPWFGGSPSVWTTVMLFFQCLLSAGYAHAHLLHVLLVLAAAVLARSILPDATFGPQAGDAPVASILALLAWCVGLPYSCLSATGPLIQHWFGKAHPGRSPYRLYALSNLGSFLSLLTFPCAFEPLLTLQLSWSHFTVMRLICLLYQGELVRAKPTEHRHLTDFYLCIEMGVFHAICVPTVKSMSADAAGRARRLCSVPCRWVHVSSATDTHEKDPLRLCRLAALGRRHCSARPRPHASWPGDRSAPRPTLRPADAERSQEESMGVDAPRTRTARQGPSRLELIPGGTRGPWPDASFEWASEINIIAVAWNLIVVADW